MLRAESSIAPAVNCESCEIIQFKVPLIPMQNTVCTKNFAASHTIFKRKQQCEDTALVSCNYGKYISACVAKVTSLLMS